jgi:hypothetical protein
MTDPGDMGSATVFLRPLDRLVLGLERRERLIRMVIDDIIVNGASSGPPLRLRLCAAASTVPAFQ